MFRRTDRFVLLFLCVWLVGPVSAQQDQEELFARMQEFSNELHEAYQQDSGPGNFAAVYRELRRGIPAGVEQSAATWLSFVGVHDEAQVIWDRQGFLGGPAVVPLPEEGSKAPAVNAIVEAARDHRVVMINEAHHVAMHRELTRQLLEPLYDQGFRYLAMETLDNEEIYETDGHVFEEHGHPTFQGGYYSQEPVFAQLIRTALDLGYVLVPYEMRGTETEGRPGIERREIAQASYLTRFLDENPDEKLLVHLGFAHLYEVPVGGNAWMAARLKELNDLDPLTVDQTRMYSRSAAKFENPLYRESISKFDIDEPSVLFDAEGRLWNDAAPAGSYDISVIHPPVQVVKHRPSWLATSPLRIEHVVEEGPTLAEGEWLLMQAFDPDEDPSRDIPVDQFVLKPGQTPTFYLPEGEHQLRAVNANGEVVWEN